MEEVKSIRTDIELTGSEWTTSDTTVFTFHDGNTVIIKHVLTNEQKQQLKSWLLQKLKVTLIQALSEEQVK